MSRQLTVADREQILALAYSQRGIKEMPAGSNRVKYTAWWGFTGPWCFTGDTLVDTPNGLIEIQDLKVGDLVLSRTNQPRKIEKVLVREKGTIRLKAYGLDGTNTTKDHPYLAKRLLSSNKDGRILGEAEWIKAGELKKGDFIAFPIKDYGEVEIDPALAYFIGRYVADGWKRLNKPRKGRNTPRYGVSICSSYPEADDLSDFIKDAGFNVCRANRRTNVQFEVSNKALWERLNDYGYLAHGKRVSGEVFTWNREGREAFLRGYLDGDGHLSLERNRWQVGTVSRELAIGICQVARSLGYTPALNMYERKSDTCVIEGRTVKRRIKVWDISFQNEIGPNHQTIIENGYMWSPVRSIEEGSVDFVYDLTVADEHSFIADGVAVHNCAMYVSWDFYNMLGFSPFPATTSKGFAYCPSGVSWFKSKGKWASKTTRPQRGWIVFFDFGKGRPSHVGIVLDVLKDGRIHTIEGNTSSGGSQDNGGIVVEHYRSTSSIVGYGIIDYTYVKPVPSKPPVVIPAMPTLTASLTLEDYKTNDPQAVRYVHNRLNVILPHWNYKGPKNRGDGRFDETTLVQVVYFKGYANKLADLNKQERPFPVINGVVGSKTMAILAWYGAYYQST